MSRSRKLLLFSLTPLLYLACNVLTSSALTPTPGPTMSMETALAIAASTAEIPRPTPTQAALGTLENPLIIALPPGSAVIPERVEAGKAFAEQLHEVTGYDFVVVAPDSYAKLVTALGQGNAHIAVLSPYAYAVARNEGSANALFASLKNGEKTYGAQFIAKTESGFQPYFDAIHEINIADAATALSQFRNKKPCWPDEVSLSGYIIPSGILAMNDIPLRTGAILQGQPTVVRAVYVGGICDFGATYIDARSFPAVLNEYPDVLEKVAVIWRIPPVIPYDVMVVARDVPAVISQSLNDALFRITGMQAGRQVLGSAYGIEDWERITDSFYDEFWMYMNASSIDLEKILE